MRELGILSVVRMKKYKSNKGDFGKAALIYLTVISRLTDPTRNGLQS